MKLTFNSDLYTALRDIANAQNKAMASLIMSVLKDYVQHQSSIKEKHTNGINKPRFTK